MRHQRLLQKFLINKKAQILVHRASKVDKGKSKLKTQESIAERTKLRRHKIDMVVRKKKTVNNELFNYFLKCSNPDIMFRGLRDSTDEKNKSLVESINKKLTKSKKIIKNLPNDNESKKMKK